MIILSMNEKFVFFFQLRDDIERKIYAECKEYSTGKEIRSRTGAICDSLKKRKQNL